MSGFSPAPSSLGHRGEEVAQALRVVLRPLLGAGEERRGAPVHALGDERHAGDERALAAVARRHLDQAPLRRRPHEGHSAYAERIEQ
ncbi:MAG: hypothetical protein AUH85_17440 [Chloroflexi bacterium 13_1_40CM_4_68_4]|nr:MAG: hypothetical protein AUH85_17440 [Chloroflexi bacterium 13_1_40CM_4_68_4]